MIPSDRPLTSMIDSADDEDPPSITEVNGKIARFEMAYNAPVDERVRFGPPTTQLVPSIAYLGLAIGFCVFVAVAHSLSPASRLFVFVVERDAGRPVGSVALAAFLLLSAMGTVLRASMRGVVIHKDGIETRDLLPLGIPKIQKWAWPQVDRILLADDAASVELWNGRFERLPKVRETKKMHLALAAIGRARHKEVTVLENLKLP